jgi:soluble lytic murein transglycosylase-like protein
VALENMGQTGAAAGVYRSLAASSSDYYYRMLAQQRLGTVGRTDHWDDLPMFRHLLQSAVDADELTVGAGHEAWALSDPGLGLDHLLEERKKIIYQPELTQGSAELNITLRRLKTLAAVGAMDLAFLEADRLAEIASRTRRAAGGRSMSSDERRQFEAELDALRGRLFAFRSAYLAEAQVYDRFVRLQYSYRKTLYTGAAREDKGVARRRFLPLCYPAELLDASRTHHLHPALILAIMRNESLYQADILSGANARGLMQVLPSTAAKICRRTGQTTPDYDQLFEPAVNIELAAWYISALIEEFDGQLPLALASYNAGPFNVKRWVRQAPNISMELFVETIPFEQTNQYVKKILGTFYEYRMHYAGVKSMPDLSPAVRSQFLDAVNF